MDSNTPFVAGLLSKELLTILQTLGVEKLEKPIWAVKKTASKLFLDIQWHLPDLTSMQSGIRHSSHQSTQAKPDITKAKYKSPSSRTRDKQRLERWKARRKSKLVSPQTSTQPESQVQLKPNVSHPSKDQHSAPLFCHPGQIGHVPAPSPPLPDLPSHMTYPGPEPPVAPPQDQEPQSPCLRPDPRMTPQPPPGLPEPMFPYPDPHPYHYPMSYPFVQPPIPLSPSSRPATTPGPSTTSPTCPTTLSPSSRPATTPVPSTPTPTTFPTCPEFT